jgi:hypothetical protein
MSPRAWFFSLAVTAVWLAFVLAAVCVLTT